MKWKMEWKSGMRSANAIDILHCADALKRREELPQIDPLLLCFPHGEKNFAYNCQESVEEIDTLIALDDSKMSLRFAYEIAIFAESFSLASGLN